MEKDCFFCQKYASKAIVFESPHFFIVYDDFPLRRGHMLLLPIRHAEEMTALTREEFNDLYFVLQGMVRRIQVEFQADGYNVGVNCGEAAGQTMRHLHIHLVPRYIGDVPNPRGGIRKFLPNPLSEYPPS